MRRKNRRDLATHWIDQGLYIAKMTGSPGFVGLVMVEAWFSDDPWMTVSAVGDRLQQLMSEDTIRRQLDALVKINRARKRVERRRAYYCIEPRVAKAIMTQMEAYPNT